MLFFTFLYSLLSGRDFSGNDSLLDIGYGVNATDVLEVVTQSSAVDHELKEQLLRNRRARLERMEREKAEAQENYLRVKEENRRNWLLKKEQQKQEQERDMQKLALNRKRREQASQAFTRVTVKGADGAVLDSEFGLRNDWSGHTLKIQLKERFNKQVARVMMLTGPAKNEEIDNEAELSEFAFTDLRDSIQVHFA